MSPLEQWFSRNPHIGRSEFARRVGVTPGRITQLCDSVKPDTPSLKLALRIAEKTRGQVRPEDWETGRQ